MLTTCTLRRCGNEQILRIAQENYLWELRSSGAYDVIAVKRGVDHLRVYVSGDTTIPKVWLGVPLVAVRREQ